MKIIKVESCRKCPYFSNSRLMGSKQPWRFHCDAVFGNEIKREDTWGIPLWCPLEDEQVGKEK